MKPKNSIHPTQFFLIELQIQEVKTWQHKHTTRRITPSSTNTQIYSHKGNAAATATAKDTVMGGLRGKHKRVASEESTEAGVESDGASEGEAAFLGFGVSGGGAEGLTTPIGRSTWSIWYTASWPSVYTVLATDVLVSPDVMFTWFPDVVIFREKSPLLLPPACVLTGLLTVWNCEVERKEDTTWNCTSWAFCWSVNEFRVPALRFEKALSVGANMVRPWFELLSWMLIRSSIWVLFSSRMKVVYWPAFSRIAVMLVGPAGAGAGAEDWPEVLVHWRKRISRRTGETSCFIIFSGLFWTWVAKPIALEEKWRRVALDEFGGGTGVLLRGVRWEVCVKLGERLHLTLAREPQYPISLGKAEKNRVGFWYC